MIWYCSHKANLLLVTFVRSKHIAQHALKFPGILFASGKHPDGGKIVWCTGDELCDMF